MAFPETAKFALFAEFVINSLSKDSALLKQF